MGDLADPLVSPASDGSDASAGTASQLALCANLITATLGCGILSLPWATAGSSLIPAILLTLLVLAVNAGTNMILVQSAEKYQIFDLGGLLRCLPAHGKLVKALLEVTIWLTVFMCLVGYLIVVADSCKLLLPELPRSMRVGVSGMIVLPLCFMDQQHLAFSSTLSIAANVYVCVLLLSLFASGWRKPAADETDHDCCMLGFGEGNVTMVSALMQAAVVQMCILPMYEEMSQRSPRRFAACMGFSFSFVAVLFVTFCGVAYFVLGPRVSSNVLLDLPPGPFGSFARVAMAVAVIGVYPILLSSMVAPIKHQDGRHSRLATIATFTIVICSAVAASFTSNLGQVNVLSGASQVFVFVALSPGLAGLFLLGQRGIAWKICMVLLIVIGFIVSCAGIFFTDNFVEELQAKCMWNVLRAVH